MSILSRIIAACCLVAVIGAGQSALTIWTMNRLAGQIATEAERPVVVVDAARAAWDGFRTARGFLSEYTDATRHRPSREAIPAFRQHTAAVEAELARVANSGSAAEVTGLARNVGTLAQEWQAAALVLMGQAPATSIPAPHIMARREEQVRVGLQKLVTLALAEATAVRTDMVEDATSARNCTILLAVLGGIAGLALGILAALSITRPIGRIVAAMQKLADGDVEIGFSGKDRKDEIGNIARMLEVFRVNAVERGKLEALSEQTRQKEIERQRQLEALITQFRATMQRITGTLGSETGAMREAAQTLSGAATSAAARAQSASAASSAAAADTQTVAAATEELSASIREIAVQANRASDVVVEATRVTQATDNDVRALADASRRIDDIMKMITEIAAQTNLLALNSTIEAARAGEAGRGFAVVANEVKSLAARTGQAASEVGEIVKRMRETTNATVNSITSITGKITEIADLNGAIAAAVEEQQAATSEIAVSVSNAAGRTENAVSSVDGVTQAAAETRQQSERVAGTSESLAKVTAELSTMVEAFLRSVGDDLAERRRSVRRQVRETVTIEAGGRRLRATVTDASEGGLRIEPNPGLQTGQRIKVDLGAGTVAARVRWTDATRAGIAFEDALAHPPFQEPPAATPARIAA